MSLTPTQKSDALVACEDLDLAALQVKRLLNQKFARLQPLTPEELRPLLGAVIRSACCIAGIVGIEPIHLTDDVHAGRD